MPKAEATSTGKDAETPPIGVDRLFRDHNELLVRLLRARLGSEAEAHEAAQEAYVRLLQLDRPDQPSFMRAYLFKIAANVATDMLRRRQVIETAASRDEFPTEEPALQERGLDARQQLAIVQAALDEL